jgi:chorismate mutase / prephenate dehydratase
MAKKRPTAADVRKLDREILELLNQRAEAELSQGTEDGERALLSEAGLKQLVESNDGPLSAVAVQNIYRELLSGIRAARHPTRVAYLGPEYTYSHLAAIARFGQSAELMPVSSIAAVFDEVEQGPRTRAGDGATGARSTQICGEVPLRIHHCLLGIGTRTDVRRVCSKPQALSQCRNWLSTHLPNVKLEPTASTAEAAALAAAEPDTAAIAAEQAGVNHGLTVLARNIEDNPDNVTRFAVIGTKAADRTGRDKTALVFEAPHQPGALADAMAIFKRQRLNLTWIESFPIPRERGRYLFFLEFQGHPADAPVKKAIAALEKKSLRLVLLGSYAEADVVG